MTLQLSKTKFDFNLHDKTEINSSIYGDYIFYNLDAWNKIIVNGKAYEVMYQTGHLFHGNDLNAPTNDIEFYDEGSAELCNILYEIYESDFDDKELLAERLENIQALDANIDTAEKLHELYVYFNDNKPTLRDFVEIDEE
jgi:hypothetical protein